MEKFLGREMMMPLLVKRASYNWNDLKTIICPRRLSPRFVPIRSGAKEEEGALMTNDRRKNSSKGWR